MDHYQPYNYLQIVYHEIGSSIKAADAAWTFLQKHPDDEEMKGNLEYYKWKYPEVDRRIRKKELQNLEVPLYNRHFINGTKAYDSAEYDKCVSNIEVALKGYFKAKDDCEGLCYQMKAQMDRFPQFWRNIAEMEYGSVKCKNDCLDKIAAEVNNIKIEDPVPLMLNYLQFCYYKVNKILEAANAAKSQELLTPNDENAKKNVQYYMGKVIESGHKDFQVRYREDIVRYLYKRRQMANLEYFAGQFLEYHDEADVLPETTEAVNLEELITDEITKQLGSTQFKETVDSKIKDEL